MFSSESISIGTIHWLVANPAGSNDIIIIFLIKLTIYYNFFLGTDTTSCNPEFTNVGHNKPELVTL